MKSSLLLTISCLLFHFSFSQSPNLDSLHTIWQDQTQSDSTRTSAYNKYVWNGFLFSKPDTAFVLAQNLLRFGETQPYPKASALAFNLMGISCALRSDHPKALDFYHRSLTIQKELGDKIGIASSLGNIGIIYDSQGNYHKALDYYHRSLDIKEEIGDKNGISKSLNNIGSIYYQQGNFPKALDYYQHSLRINEEIGEKGNIAKALNNIGLIYQDHGETTKALDYYQRSLKIIEELGDKKRIASSLNNIGNIYKLQGETTKALDNYQRSLKIKEEIGDKGTIGNTLNNIGNIYSKQGENSKALSYHQRSLKVAEEIGAKMVIAATLNDIGSIYQKQGETNKALKYCKEGKMISREIGDLEEEKSACQCLYDISKTMGNDGKALEYYEQMVVLKDSLYNKENTKKLTQLEMQYEFDKKEAAAKAEQEKKDAIAAQELERQKLVRNGFMGGFAVVLLFAGIFFVQRNRIGKEKARSEELLLNILPEETAQELKEKGHSDAQLIDEVTVLFTDFKGFTALSEQMTPKELVEDLHKCFSAFDNICEKYGIEKIKTIGDAYMAAGGLPSPNATHAQDVVNAALEMAKVVENGKAKKIAEGLPYFEIRIGIHTGPVVAGIVGIKKFQYDIWGDTVNTASRLESSGEVGKVNISQTTYELVKNQFACEHRGKIKAKGKGELEMFYISKKKV